MQHVVFTVGLKSFLEYTFSRLVFGLCLPQCLAQCELGKVKKCIDIEIV